MTADLHINERVIIPGSDLHWTAVRASGAGGQNVNKVATKVDLRFDLRSTQALGPRVKARLQKLARGRIDARGRIAITSQLTRTLTQNLEDARRKLADLIRQALPEPKRRRATKPTRGARERRLSAKKRNADKKLGRQKVRD